MKSWIVMLMVGAVIGCSSTDQAPGQPQTMVAALSSSTNTNADVRLAYTTDSDKSRLSELLSGVNPKDFRWVMFAMDPSALDSLRSPNGLSVNLQTSARFSFSQVYQGPCNPALNNFDNCWLYEALVAGAQGVKGLITLKLVGDEVTGAFDVSIEGETDRFGEPLQWHKHGTEGGVSAKLLVQGEAR